MALISPDVTLTAKLVLPDLISYLRLNSVAQSHHPSFSPSLPVLNFLLSPFTCSCLVMQQITSNSKLVVCQCRHSLSSLSLHRPGGRVLFPTQRASGRQQHEGLPARVLDQLCEGIVYCPSPARSSQLCVCVLAGKGGPLQSTGSLLRSSGPRSSGFCLQ